jgi:hypothetical protein
VYSGASWLLHKGAMMKKLLLAILILLSSISASFAQTINSLGAGGAVSGTDIYPSYQGANPATGVSADQIDAYALPHPGYITNFWYLQPNMGQIADSNAMPANKIDCKYSAIPKLVTIKSLGVFISTIGTTNIQLAIYKNASGRPSTLIANTASIADNGSTGIASAAIAASQIGPGGGAGGKDIWFCVESGDATVKMHTESTTDSSLTASFIGSATASDIIGGSSATGTGIECSGAGCTGGSSTFGTWPATLAGSTWTIVSAPNQGNYIPVQIFQVQSSP